MHPRIAYFKHYTAVCLTQNDPKRGGAGVWNLLKSAHDVSIGPSHTEMRVTFEKVANQNIFDS
eukprot:scaffold71985_cov46-Attheya_sp.AAC.1